MIKVFETFSGYGGWSWGLKKANIPFEVVGHSEIDKYAIQCYNQNFPNIKNYGDITKIDPKELPDFDLLCTSPPCQAFSIAGKRKGFEDTRGTLFFDVARIIKEKQPKFVLFENVKGLVNHNKGDTLQVIKNTFFELGYQIAYKVLNTKDYGIPQNRERIFIVAIRNDIYIPFMFRFPEKEPLKLLLKDILEDEVEEKYYLSELATDKLIRHGNSSLSKSDYKNPKSIYEMSNRVYNPEGIAPTLTKVSGGNQEKKIILNATYRHSFEGFKGYENISPTVKGSESSGNQIVIPCLTPDRLEKRQNGRRFKEDGEEMFTLNTQDKHGIYDGYKIRKLTPKECFRLQGFLNDEINLDGLSDTQKYRLAGNGISINVTEKLFLRLKSLNKQIPL